MKKILSVVLVWFMAAALLGCDLFGPKDKEFSGSGITITLNDEFTETETVIAPLYLTSLNNIFMGMREEKSQFSGTFVNSLQAYTDAVLSNGGHPDSETYESEGDTTYIYAYYTAQVDDREYGYMLVCMESDTYYYLMNFGCVSSHLDENKDQYIDWADTIQVD